jgi:bacteriorhodopsin
MISIELLTLVLINTIFLFVLLVKTILSTEFKRFQSIRNAELAILAIAFTQYGLTFIIENSNVLNKDANLFAQQLRYFDWLITTPLLLYTYWKLANIDGYKDDFFLLFAMDVVMIVSGMVAELFVKDTITKYIFFIIGGIAYGVIFWKVLEIMNFYSDKHETKKQRLGFYFLIGWLVYPLAFFLNDEFKFILYSIGDFINKGLYSISLNEIISDE